MAKSSHIQIYISMWQGSARQVGQSERVGHKYGKWACHLRGKTKPTKASCSMLLMMMAIEMKLVAVT